MTGNRKILVFGATGQQGGSVADALLAAGWEVRALVRDTGSTKAEHLHRNGVELISGDFDDTNAMRKAMADIHGVFSVQPSSPSGVITDEDEVRYGVSIATLAAEQGIGHLVYSSGNAVRAKLTGVGHFDSKARIEAHIRALPIAATIVRPAAFMEMLLMPGFGLEQKKFTFFQRPDQSMQFIAVQDIGKIVRAVFEDKARFAGETLEIAGDAVTGQELGEAFSEMAGFPIIYERFSDSVLAANPFLGKLSALVDEGSLSGHADLESLRQINPDLRSFRSWLFENAGELFKTALGTSGSWDYNR